MYDTLLDALRRGATAEALAAAHAAVATAPEDATAHRLLAAALRLGGDQVAALASLDRAIALAPDEADLHLERAGLLLGTGQLDAAQAALARSTGLDPNQFPAYVIQAQLALGQGELDEAERLSRLAARIAPEHPQLTAIKGTLMLRRGDATRAQAVLASAVQRYPDEPQLRYALGFAYLAQGHLAFAEQAFRGVLERTPDNPGLRGLVADLLLRQGRPADAAAELAPLLADPARATPGLRRAAGELELAANRPEQALPLLREAFVAQPQERRTLLALIEAWRRLDAGDEARTTLDAALAAQPEQVELWQARLAFEPFADAGAHAVIDRWLLAMPDFVPALEAKAVVLEAAGDHAAAEATTRRVLALEPGRTSAELRLLNTLLARDPGEALARVEDLVARAPSAEAKRGLRDWLGYVQDRAGQPHAAVATWAARNADVAAERLPLTEPSKPIGQWPEFGDITEGGIPKAFLFGAPGSGVEHLVAILLQAQLPVRGDRFGANPPNDAFQRYQTIAELEHHQLDPAAMIAEWGGLLAQRGFSIGVIDWLPWWDNVLLRALRPHLPGAALLIALRDPRDMLLDWFAYGAPAPFAITSPLAAAGWLAQQLNQVAALHEQDLHPHRLLRLDEVHQNLEAIAVEVGGALGLEQIQVPPVEALGPARFPAGHWRQYAEALAEPFALLTPVARRLGYDEA